MKGIQHAIEAFVDEGVQPVAADSDDDGNQHRVRKPIAGGAVQECRGRPSRRSRSTSCAALVHRVGYSIGYSSGAPRLRHVHDVRFRLFMRRRYRGPRRIHSHRPRRGSPSAVARRGERRDHRSISGRYLHPDRKSVTNAQSGGRCLSRLQRDRPQPVQELLRGADDEHAPILPADGPVLAAYSGQPARARHDKASTCIISGQEGLRCRQACRRRGPGGSLHECVASDGVCGPLPRRPYSWNGRGYRRSHRSCARERRWSI